MTPLWQRGMETVAQTQPRDNTKRCSLHRRKQTPSQFLPGAEIKGCPCPLRLLAKCTGGNKTIKTPLSLQTNVTLRLGVKKKKKRKNPKLLTLDCWEGRAMLLDGRLWRSSELPNFFTRTFFFFFQMRKKSFFFSP